MDGSYLITTAEIDEGLENGISSTWIIIHLIFYPNSNIYIK
jgi:hypothetical protein